MSCPTYKAVEIDYSMEIAYVRWTSMIYYIFQVL